MSLLETALKLLRRPVETGVKPLPRRKPGPPQDTDPHEAEVMDVLSRLQAERVEAESTLSGAAEAREALLMQPESDEAIFELGRAIDRANLQLERIDRIEPDLRRMLGELKYSARGARWVVDRDAATVAFAVYVEAIEHYEQARSGWARVWNDLAAKWPTATEIMPTMPALNGNSTGYAAGLEAFRSRVIVLAAPPMPLYASLAQAIEFARQTGHAPEGVPLEWLGEIQRAITNAVNVQMLVGGLDGEGRPLAKGTIIEMSYEDAQRAVTSGRAIYCAS